MAAEKTDATAYRKGEFSDASDHDTESINGPPQHATLQRKLKNRHIAMIRCVGFHSIPIKCSPSSSIGGVIGTGLFVGTASSLANGGPVGLLLGYLVMGSIVYCVMITLGEMVCPPSSTYGHISYLHSQIAFLPIPGGHIKLAERFIDPAFSFAMGWNYWYNWAIVCKSHALSHFHSC
jgi:amino acid transporter